MFETFKLYIYDKLYKILFKILMMQDIRFQNDLTLWLKN